MGGPTGVRLEMQCHPHPLGFCGFKDHREDGIGLDPLLISRPLSPLWSPPRHGHGRDTSLTQLRHVCPKSRRVAG